MSQNSSIWKTKNKYMKDYDKNKESLYFKYWDVNNLCGWMHNVAKAVSIEDTSQFNEDFI